MSKSEFIAARVAELVTTGKTGCEIAVLLFAEGFRPKAIEIALENAGYYVSRGFDAGVLKVSDQPNPPGYLRLAWLINLYTWPSVVWPPAEME
jgi:hypothetical protein